MSYRLITKAVLAITNAAGETTSADVEVRAYPAPKRDASGTITVDGKVAQYKRTGGKGRGVSDTRYMYFPMKGESAYCAITEAQATALVGGQVAIDRVVAVEPTPAVVEQPTTPVEPTPEAPAENTAPVPALTRAQRRAAKANA